MRNPNSKPNSNLNVKSKSEPSNRPLKLFKLKFTKQECANYDRFELKFVHTKVKKGYTHTHTQKQ